MEMTSSSQRKLTDGMGRERIEVLLARYPNIDTDETAEILRFLKKGPLLQIGLLSSDETLKPQLDRFRSDHAKQFGLGAEGLLVAAVIVVAITLVSVLLWNAGVTH